MVTNRGSLNGDDLLLGAMYVWHPASPQSTRINSLFDRQLKDGYTFVEGNFLFTPKRCVQYPTAVRRRVRPFLRRQSQSLDM